MRLANPIPFDSPDGLNVQLLIILLVPESATQQHLEILAEVARLLSDDTIRNKLLTENDTANIYTLLTQSS